MAIGRTSPRDAKRTTGRAARHRQREPRQRRVSRWRRRRRRRRGGVRPGPSSSASGDGENEGVPRAASRLRDRRRPAGDGRRRRCVRRRGELGELCTPADGPARADSRGRRAPLEATAGYLTWTVYDDGVSTATQLVVDGPDERCPVRRFRVGADSASGMSTFSARSAFVTSRARDEADIDCSGVDVSP